MPISDSHAQEVEMGKKILSQKANELAKDRGIKLTECTWSVVPPAEGNDRRHLLALAAKDSLIDARYGEDELSDLPGKVGMEGVYRRLKSQVAQLKG